MRNENKKWCPSWKEELFLSSVHCSPICLWADLTSAVSPPSQSCYQLHPTTGQKPSVFWERYFLSLRRTTAWPASSAKYLKQMIALKAVLGLASQLGTVVFSWGGQTVRGAGCMHQGVLFIESRWVPSTCLAVQRFHCNYFNWLPWRQIISQAD